MSKLLLDDYSYIRGTNTSSTAFTIGTLVYISSWSNSEAEFDLAISTDDTKYAIGIALQNIPIGGKGRILTKGKIKVDNKASLLSEGDVLYLSNVAGEYTTTAPSDVYKIGEVIKVDSLEATVFFNPDFLIPNLATPYLVEANTSTSGSPNIITSAETRTIFTNEGSSAKNYHTLPTAVAGLSFTFIVQDVDGIRVVANAGDTIRLAGTVSGAAGYTESTTIGDVVTLVAINATEWFAINIIGTWTTV